MTRRDAVDEWESPFLTEALTEEPEAADALEDLRRLGRRFSPAARRHLARALAVHREDTEEGVADALEAGPEEGRESDAKECECRAHEADEADALGESELDQEALDEAGFDEASPEEGETAADEESDAFESPEAFAAEDGEEGEAAWDEAEDREAEDAGGAPENEEEESPTTGLAASEDEAFLNLAGFNEMFEPEAAEADERESEAEPAELEERDLGPFESDETWGGPELESETPAEIQSHLDRVIVTTRAETLRRAPNPFDLNAVASKNTESKREVFKAVQRTWHDLLKVEARIARGSTPTLVKQKAGIETRLAERASALKAWLRAHPLDHSRARAQLQRDIKKHERGLGKLKGQARAAAEGALAGLQATLKALEASLRLAADAYEPLKDFQRRRHVVQVPSATGPVTVRLHDHVIAFATDTAAGLDGNADGDDRAQVTAALARAGISADKQAILGLISVQEGRFSTVNTWDRAVVTFGFTQWTTDADGDGTLCRLMDAVRSAAPDAYRRCFQRYGMDVDARRRLTLRLPDGRDLAGAAAARHLQTSVKHVAVLAASGLDPAVQTAQIRFAVAQKMDAMLAHVLSAGGASARLGDLLTSEYAVAVMTDRAVGTGEPGTRAAAARAFAAYVKANPKADLTQAAQRTAAGARVLGALEALDRGRAERYTSLSHAAGSYAG